MRENAGRGAPPAATVDRGKEQGTLPYALKKRSNSILPHWAGKFLHREQGVVRLQRGITGCHTRGALGKLEKATITWHNDVLQQTLVPLRTQCAFPGHI